MTNTSSEKNLNREDLFLLMESYRNLTTAITTILEQQKYVIDQQKEITIKQDQMIGKQKEVCDSLHTVTDKLKECADHLATTNKNISESCGSIESVLKEKVGAAHLDLTKQHSGINMKIYFAWGGTAAIIIALIGLIINMLP